MLSSTAIIIEPQDRFFNVFTLKELFNTVSARDICGKTFDP